MARPRKVPASFSLPAVTNVAHTSLGQSAKAGFANVLADFNEFVNDLEDKVTPEVMIEALKPTFQLSQTYVPYDTGELHESGYLEIVRRGGRRVAEMGYGKGGGASYAAYVHERVDIAHKSPTRSKFLQAALDEDYFNILNRIAAGMRKYF